MNPNHILLPTDLSELSLRPVERAPELFAGRRVTLLTVVPSASLPAPASPFAPPLQVLGAAEGAEAAHKGLKKLEAKLPSTADVECVVLTDSGTGESIAGWADRHGVDLIALSTHGRTGLRRFALGSVAESILRHARVPVIVFPAKEVKEEETRA